MTITVRSFAKINLGLRIGTAREDGFHELLTVYQTIGLHDLVRVNVARGSGIEIRCSDSRVPINQSNTCYRIVEKAIQALGASGRVVIDIEKRLPVQGGMGGASSNAVAALIGLERACFKRPVPESELIRVVDEVEEETFKTHDREVPTTFIGRLVSDKLRRLDQVAYVRFASVYRRFKDVRDFVDELQPMLNRNMPPR